MPDTPKVHPSLVEMVRVASCDYFRCRSEGCQYMGSMCPKDASLTRALTALRPTMEAIAKAGLDRGWKERGGDCGDGPDGLADPAAIVTAVLQRPMEK